MWLVGKLGRNSLDDRGGIIKVNEEANTCSPFLDNAFLLSLSSMSCKSSVHCREHPFQSSGVLQAPDFQAGKRAHSLWQDHQSGQEKQQARETALVLKIRAPVRIWSPES